MKKLFVYGTLKRNCKYNYYLSDKDSKFIEIDSIKGSMYSIDNFYPILILDELNNINGEIWEVSKYDYERTRRMELGAGYHEKTITTKKGNICTVFVITGNEEFFKNNYIKEENRISEWIEN